MIMVAEGDDDDAELVVDTHIDFPDSGRFSSVTVHLVPESETYSEGVKYSMHYGDYDGPTILRYDNPHEDTKGHERRTRHGAEEGEFHGWRNLIARFREEVVDHEREHDA